MAVHATHDDWAGRHCELYDLSYNMVIQNDGRVLCTTRSEHLFTCYNNSGADASIKVEYNQTVWKWVEGVGWQEVHRDAPEPTFPVNEDDSYNHHDWLADEGHPWKRSMVVEIGDDRAYRLYPYTDLRLTGDNLHDEKTVAIPQPQA